MIRNWLIKHWWINEIGKTAAAIFFGAVSYGLYVSGGKEFAFAAGIIFVLCMVCVADVVTVLIRKIMGKPIYEAK